MNSNPAITAPSGRKAWVDAGKGISMLLVVLFHCEIYNPAGNSDVSALFNFFRMPFFFFLSGYVFTRNHLAFSFRSKIKQIARGIVWPYFVFTFLILIPKSLLNGSPVSEGSRLILIGQASWFIVSLGTAQVIFACLLRLTKRQSVLIAAMLISLGLGYIVKGAHPESLPFYFDRSLIVVFFFGLGFFYRLYESQVLRCFKISRLHLLLTAVLYFGLTLLDMRFLHTVSAFNTYVYINFPLFLLYAIIGIVMMTQFTQALPMPRALRYIGRNSLIYYYLNGGSAKIVYILLGPILVCGQSLSLPYAILATLLSSLLLSAVAWFIRHYCPLLTGDKEAFNRMARKLHCNIRF